MNILLVEVHRNRLTICGGTKLNVKEAFEDSEFLGPITPADAEQLVRLRTLVMQSLDLASEALGEIPQSRDSQSVRVGIRSRIATLRNALGTQREG